MREAARDLMRGVWSIIGAGDGGGGTSLSEGLRGVGRGARGAAVGKDGVGSFLTDRGARASKATGGGAGDVAESVNEKAGG